MKILRAVPVLSIALTLGACATSGDYPSLAQRPAERVEGTFTPEEAAPVAPAPITPTADLAARLAENARQAEAAHREFVSAVPSTERLASGAGATGTDSWAAAQVALANLDSIRSRVAVNLADLDSLWVDSTIEPGPREAIGSVRSTVEALVAEEDAVLARLRGRL